MLDSPPLSTRHAHARAAIQPAPVLLMDDSSDEEDGSDCEDGAVAAARLAVAKASAAAAAAARATAGAGTGSVFDSTASSTVEFDDNSGLPSVLIALRDLQEATDSRPNHSHINLRGRSVIIGNC
jgi:hypothetical protein